MGDAASAVGNPYAQHTRTSTPAADAAGPTRQRYSGREIERLRAGAQGNPVTLAIMSHIRLFQILVVASAAITAAWYALPHMGLAYDARTAQLLGLSGDGASPFTQSPMFYLSFGVAKLVSTIGLLLRANWGRWVLFAVTGASWAAIPFSGIVVAAPLDCLIGTVLGYGDGVILALAFYGPISDRFRKALPV